ncbi:hypothetical protein CGRA01v4_06913 [Colletotrichum graminicola]|nr:hypothetical protein CGRA01v4_06913 [Colletotrichum graminicola]
MRWPGPTTSFPRATFLNDAADESEDGG